MLYLRRMAHVRTAPAHAFFFGALVVWSLWALYICADAVPGLLDDGTHLLHSERYRTDGFLATVGGDLAAVGQHARFYEIQYALLGLYNVLFGHHLALWYLANHAFGLATGLLIYAVIRMTTRSVPGAITGSLVFLTGSPMAEAARANFGKAEVVMTFLFVCSIALLVLARHLGRTWSSSGRGPRAAIAAVAAMGLASLLLAAVAKESGRLLGLALVLTGLVGARSRPRDGRARLWIGSLGAIGLLGAATNMLVFWPSHDNPYLRSYFSLDLSASHLWQGAAFYASQNGDVILIALAALPWVVAGLRRRATGDGDGARGELFVALFLSAAIYAGALLAIRFHLSYYLYVPAALFALALGWAVAIASPRARMALLVVAAATRLYSVPYNVAIGEAQRDFDRVNDEAMRRVATLAPPRVIALDLSETSQFIQEWNLLRWFSFDGVLAPLYGASPLFESWLYQDDLRGLDRRSYDPAAIYGNLDPARLRVTSTIDPSPGDLITFRSGTMRRFHCFLRGVLPQHLDGTAALAAIDPDALAWVGRAGDRSSAARNGGSFDYRWEFFRVVARPRFLVAGREGDGWALEVPGWLPFSYPVHLSTIRDAERLAVMEVPKAGMFTWAIPCDRPGTVWLRSDQWFQPSSLGVAPDTRTLSYRVTAISLAEDPAPGGPPVTRP